MSATAESIDVRITGDASGATGAMTRVGEAVSGAVTAMQQKLIDLGIASKESFGVVGESSLKAAAHVEESSSIIGHATEKMKMHMESVATKYEAVTGLMGKLNGVMVGALALLAGGEGFEKAIEKTNELAAANLKLSKTFGISLADASGMHAALAKFGIDTETVTGAVQKMDRQLKSHESALVDMGVKTRDGNGELRNQLDIFMSGLDALRDYKEGTDRNLAAQAMFGRGVGDVAALLKLNRKELEEGAESARKLGLVTDQEGVDSMKRYKVAINETKEVFEAIMVAIGKKVLPAITEMADYIKDHGKTIMENFRRALDLVGEALEVLGAACKALWDVATAAFGAIGDIITEVLGTKAASEFGKFDNWLLLIKGSIQIFKGAAILAFQVIGAGVTELAARAFAAGPVIRDFLTMQWDKTGDDWDRGMKAVSAIVDANAKKIKATLADMMTPVTIGDPMADTRRMLADSMRNGLASDATGGKGGKGDKHFAGAPKKEKAGKADPSEMADLEEALVARKLALDKTNEADNTFREMSKAEEAKYWQDILARTDLSAKDRQAITRKYLDASLADKKTNFAAMIAMQQAEIVADKGNGDAKIAMAHKIEAEMIAAYGKESKEAAQAGAARIRVEQAVAAERSKLATETAKSQEALALEVLTAEEAAAKHRAEIGQITAKELLKQELEFQAEKLAIQERAIAAQIAAAKLGPDSEAAVKKLNDARLLLEQKYQDARTALIAKAETQRTAIVRGAENQVVNLFSQSLAKMVTLQQGFITTIKGLFQGMQSIIGDVLSKVISRFVSDWLEAHGVMKAIDKLFGIDSVANAAAAAGAGGVASMALAPFPLNLGAPAFGASMAAASASFGSLLSARGGFDIPAGMNPITQLHEREMVLPAAQADVVRDMATSGGKSGGDTHHWHIQTMDAHSFRDFAKRNQSTFVLAMKGGYRDGAR